MATMANDEENEYGAQPCMHCGVMVDDGEASCPDCAAKEEHYCLHCGVLVEPGEETCEDCTEDDEPAIWDDDEARD